MQLRMRAAAGGLTAILLLQPFALLACVYACLGHESDSPDLHAPWPGATPAASHNGALRSTSSDTSEGVAIAQPPDSCTHPARDPATLRSSTGDAASRAVPAIMSRATLTWSAATGDSFVRLPAGSESPPGARFLSPLRI